MNKLKISPLTVKSGSNDYQRMIAALQLELKTKDALLKGFHTDNERLEQQVDKLTEDKNLLSLKYGETVNKLKALDGEYHSLRRELEESKRLQSLLEEKYENEKVTWNKQEEIQMKYVQLQQSINQYVEQIQTLQQDKIDAITYYEGYIEESDKILQEYLEELKQVERQYSECVTHYETELSSLDNQLQQQKESFKHQINIYENQVNFKNSIIDELSSRLELLIQDNEKMNAFLFEEVNTGLNISDQLLMEVSKVEKEYGQLERKYNALSNSKLGKLTLKYWQSKKRGTRGE